ncbi:probable polygalacturonase At3g15720 [Cicer arietinum]|uniref:Probable polygalacturonase At3g15720 n=1 Tax=Cicer arietinum TaxID=3827 RepID=A0A1S2Y322_CICAR|nr:probable polygalacturonase At3g15720 [Cicer arietinum]
MKILFAFFLLFFIASPSLCSQLVNHKILLDDSNYFNVLNYGAKGDGQTDDSNAFLKAWQDVCSTRQSNPTLLIPNGKRFMLQPVSFQGPCISSRVNVVLQGTISAPKSIEEWDWTKGDVGKSWIQFWHINGLVINGGGTVDGQGAPWWNKFHDQTDLTRPTALRFSNCDNLNVATLTHINSPKNHISITSCDGVRISNLHINAPEESPNTDGFDISSSSNILIYHSTISTGDDCIAINSGSNFINITDVYCGPGHGISVGSLGKDGDFAMVEEVLVKNCTFSGTTNGARIKTWVGGRGYARKITFEDIKLYKVDHPVIIDQQYDALLSSTNDAVKISDVTYRKIRGTSNDNDAIELNCASIGCTNIVFENIYIIGVDGETTSSSCRNVEGTSSYCNPKIPCL